MGLLSVVLVSSICAGASAAASYRALRRGKTSTHELWLLSLAALGSAFVLSLYLLFWFGVTDSNIRELLLPDLFDRRPKRVMFTSYALASVALGVGAVAFLTSLLGRGGKA
jgi:hypothetical protein